MPRRPRDYLPGVPAHVIQRGNNRTPCFFTPEDYRFYKECLGEACRRHGVELYAYVLMTNHTHLLMAPTGGDGISRVMQSLGRRYVQHVNRIHARTGTLWEGRHRASLVEAEAYLLACYRYIELNPVRAGMVEHPAEYRWSSYRSHACGEPDDLLSPHPLYLALGGDGDRHQHYRALFPSGVPPAELEAIRLATRFSVPLGNDRFRRHVETSLGRPTGHAGRGRPRHPKGSGAGKR